MVERRTSHIQKVCDVTQIVGEKARPSPHYFELGLLLLLLAVARFLFAPAFVAEFPGSGLGALLFIVRCGPVGAIFTPVPSVTTFSASISHWIPPQMALILRRGLLPQLLILTSR